MEIEDRLWNDAILDANYRGDSGAHQSAILEQYRLYVEMADRVSQRRGLANTFFLTLNTAIFALVAVFWNGQLKTDEWWLIFALVAVVGQCAAWFYIVRSYRLLNAVKYQVVGALEQRLPASPFWRAEWKLLGAGKEPRKYWPLSHIEKWIPILFAGSYIAAAVAAIGRAG